MTSLMTSQRDIKVCLLYSCLNEIVTFSPWMLWHSFTKFHTQMHLDWVQGPVYFQGQRSQSRCSILSTHIPFVPCQSAIPFLRYDFFKIWPWKSKVKVMGEGNVESHKVGVTSYRFTSLSFHVNRPFHSWDTAFSKFDLENPRSRSNDHDVAQLQVKTIP